MLNYAEGFKVVPLLGSVDIVATATPSQYVALKDVVGLLEVEVNFGLITSTDSTGGVVVTLEASSAGSSNATEAAIAFGYRLSGAVATDTMGAIAQAAAAGVEILNAVDNVTLLCYVDPSAVTNSNGEHTYVRAVVTPTAEVTSTVVGVVARYLPRYAGNAIPSSS